MTENETNAASGSSPAIDAVLKRRRASVIEVVDAKSAVDLATAQSYSENVFLFVPNLIGEPVHTPLTRLPPYVLSFIVVSSLRWDSLASARQGYCRVMLAALAMHYMNHHPKYSTIAYCVSQLLDAVDGHAARYLGQASKFGAVLDMVTDRCVSLPILWALVLTVFTIRSFNTTTEQPQAAYYVISLQHIHNMRLSSNSLSRSTSAVTTCTCTGTRFWPSSVCTGLIHPRSSLVTGSKSHKLVTSDVSRILWFYYNDPVRYSH